MLVCISAVSDEVTLKLHPVEDSGSSIQDCRMRDSRGSIDHSG